MSTIIIDYKKEQEEVVKKKYEELSNELVGLTAKLFNKKSEEIMVFFEVFDMSKSNRDIVIRAETSVKNRDLLETWAEEIENAVKTKFIEPNLVVGIKAYVVDSVWREYKVE